MDIVIDVGEVARALGVLAQRVRAAIAIGTLRALPRMAEILQREVSRQCPVDTRRLLRSIRAAPDPAHNAVIISAAFYAGPVNSRTRFIDRGIVLAIPQMEAVLLAEIKRALQPIG